MTYKMSYNTNNIDKVLGQRVDSPDRYSPSILVREERQRNRTYLGLQTNHSLLLATISGTAMSAAQ